MFVKLNCQTLDVWVISASSSTDLCRSLLMFYPCATFLSWHIMAKMSREHWSLAPSATWMESRQNSSSFGCQWQESMWMFQQHPTSTLRLGCWRNDCHSPPSKHPQSAPHHKLSRLDSTSPAGQVPLRHPGAMLMFSNILHFLFCRLAGWDNMCINVWHGDSCRDPPCSFLKFVELFVWQAVNVGELGGSARPRKALQWFTIAADFMCSERSEMVVLFVCMCVCVTGFLSEHYSLFFTKEHKMSIAIWSNWPTTAVLILDCLCIIFGGWCFMFLSPERCFIYGMWNGLGKPLLK